MRRLLLAAALALAIATPAQDGVLDPWAILEANHLDQPQWYETTSHFEFRLRGAGTSGQRNFSEWIAASAWRRYLVTGDATRLKENLPQLISVYNALSDAAVSIGFRQEVGETDPLRTGTYSKRWRSRSQGRPRERPLRRCASGAAAGGGIVRCCER